jgi:hypothetical protein
VAHDRQKRNGLKEHQVTKPFLRAAEVYRSPAAHAATHGVPFRAALNLSHFVLPEAGACLTGTPPVARAAGHTRPTGYRAHKLIAQGASWRLVVQPPTSEDHQSVHRQGVRRASSVPVRSENRGQSRSPAVNPPPSRRSAQYAGATGVYANSCKQVVRGSSPLVGSPSIPGRTAELPGQTWWRARGAPPYVSHWR